MLSLLPNSCLFIAALKKSDFLKLTFVLFGILYLSALSNNLILVSGLLLVAAGSLFFRGYYRLEDSGSLLHVYDGQSGQVSGRRWDNHAVL
jgi:high-affinity Fe2+/Pb2+ permease